MKSSAILALCASALLPLSNAQDYSDTPTGSSSPTTISSSPTSTSTGGGYSESNVPTGTPIVGSYTGPYRPQLHFSPPKYFMNDPNGLFRSKNGTWHLYYQYNPTAYVAGNQHWGHATSDDLYHWENQPIAIYPPKEEVYVFSGSAVVDSENTSGLFPDQDDGVVAIYTLAEYPGGSPGPQTQSISYSKDGGYTFTAYEKNPVIASESSQFRDPKVIWYKDHWIMVVAYAQDFAIGIFSSPNLIDWTAESNFTSTGLIGLQWECPNMVPIPYTNESGDTEDMWLLAISINPGAPLGGSATQYYPGMFNGTHFEPVDSIARVTDFGKDNYAGQFFNGLEEGAAPVFLAWASNWQYTQVAPTEGEGWRSSMSLPREVSLVKTPRLGWKLLSKPYDLSPVIGDELASKDNLGNGTLSVDFSTVESNAVYFEVNATKIPTAGISSFATLNFTFLSPETLESVRGGYFFGGDTPFFLDRSNTRGFDNVFFTDKISTNVLINAEDPSDKDSTASWSMSGVLDRSLLEVFVNEGLESATMTVYAGKPLTVLVIGATGLPEGMEVSVRVVGLKGVWPKEKDEEKNRRKRDEL